MRRFIVHALWLTLAVPALCAGEDSLFKDEYDPDISPTFEEPEAWVEGEVKLPAFPSDSGLIEFQVDRPGIPFRYFIDKQSVSLNEDGVIRYTIVIKSRQGSNNISHEGIHCVTNEYKVYAFGSGGQFKARKEPDWRRITESPADVHRWQLRNHYLCEMGAQNAVTPKEALRRLSQNQPQNTADFY